MGDEAPSFNPYKAPDAPLSQEIVPESPPVTSVAFRLTTDDFKRFKTAVQPRSARIMGRVVIGLFVLTFISLMASLTLIVLRTPRSRLWTAMAPSLAPLVFIVGFVGFLLIKNLRVPRGEPDASAEIRVELQPEGLRIWQGEISESKRAWASVAEIRDNHHLMMFVDKELLPDQRRTLQVSALVIPRRAFPTPEAAASFLGAARRWHSLATAPSP